MGAWGWKRVKTSKPTASLGDNWIIFTVPGGCFIYAFSLSLSFRFHRQHKDFPLFFPHLCAQHSSCKRKLWEDAAHKSNLQNLFAVLQEVKLEDRMKRGKEECEGLFWRLVIWLWGWITPFFFSLCICTKKFQMLGVCL